MANRTQWVEVIRSVAPVLGTLLGGPLVGTGVKIIGEALLGRGDVDAGEIEALITKGLTPEQLIKIRDAEDDFKLKMREIDLRFEEVETLDRQGARDREMSLGHWASLGVHTLGVLIIGGFFVTVYWVLTRTAPVDSETALLVGSLVGYVSAKADQVVAYFFGSSWGSKQKTKEMGEALRESIRR